ncbi:MAG: hypothetical protein GY940_30765, partial [bacterium]|nr:hypothetical protein [bacterium]
NSPGGAGYFAYFLSRVPDPVPQEISINESWTQNIGFYLFLRTAPLEDNMQHFVDQITAYFDENEPNPPHTGFAWVEYDNQGQELGTVTVVTAAEPGPEDQTVRIAANVQIMFGPYVIPLLETAPIATVIDQGANITGFTFEYPPFEGASKPRQEYNTQLSLIGNPRGALTGQVSFGNSTANTVNGFDASLYYVIHFNGRDVAQEYPLFNLAEQEGLQILFDYMLDPVDLLNPDRSYFEFTGVTFILKMNNQGEWVIESNDNNQMATFFRTIYGKKIDLIPLPDSAYPPKLVFEALPPVDGSPRFYLAPAGDFELAVQGQQEKETVETFQMLAGLSGAESFGFVSKTKSRPGDILRFEAGKDA